MINDYVLATSSVVVLADLFGILAALSFVWFLFHQKRKRFISDSIFKTLVLFGLGSASMLILTLSALVWNITHFETQENCFPIAWRIVITLVALTFTHWGLIRTFRKHIPAMFPGRKSPGV